MMAEVRYGYCAEDRVEACALKWGIGALERDAKNMPKARAEILAMRDALQKMHDEFCANWVVPPEGP